MEMPYGWPIKAATAFCGGKETAAILPVSMAKAMGLGGGTPYPLLETRNSRLAADRAFDRQSDRPHERLANRVFDSASESMMDATDLAAKTQRFNEAARAFTPPSPSRHAKLMPFKDGIVELRQKGASTRLIRELLATVNVAVSTETIARFLAEVNGESPSRRKPKRPGRERPANLPDMQPTPPAAPAGVRPVTAPLIAASPPLPASGHSQSGAALSERPRTRGPRIADPANL